MSRKTLITVLFITAVLVLIVFICLNSTVRHSESYKYSLVNTTNDESLKETSDKLDDKIENENDLIYSNSNNVESPNAGLQINSESRSYNDTVSRSMELDRRTVTSYNDNIQDNIEEISQTSVEYVDSVSEKVLLKEEFIQGVKVSTYNNITYDLYSNGYKEITNTIESVEVDNSGYNGNTGSLKSEANENIELYSERISDVLEITNKYRSEVGLNNLTLDKDLCLAASVRALEMSYTENLSHTRPDGAKCFIVLDDLDIDYNSAGENIADGFKYTENVCKAWKNSEGHYKNIVCKKYNKTGIGVAQSINGKYYWVQFFSN